MRIVPGKTKIIFTDKEVEAIVTTAMLFDLLEDAQSDDLLTLEATTGNDITDYFFNNKAFDTEIKE